MVEQQADSLLDVAKRQLAAAIDDLEAGLDVAPAQRACIETLLSQALNECRDRWDIAVFQALLRDRGSLSVDAADRFSNVVLTLWQQRAPVVPTTKD